MVTKLKRISMNLFQDEEVIDDREKSIVFLYTVSSGPCSKSHGFNAARLAGLPAAIIDRALKVAEQFEQEQNNLLELAQIINAHWKKNKLSEYFLVHYF